MMDYGGGFFPFGMVFMILYAIVVIYFLMQLAGINKALQRIASTLERKKEQIGSKSCKMKKQYRKQKMYSLINETLVLLNQSEDCSRTI